MNHIPTPRCCARVAKAFNGRNTAEVAKRFHLTECMVITIAQYHAALQEALRQPDAAPKKTWPRKDAEMATLKTRAQFRQELAEKGLSVNAWLIRVCGQALDRGAEPLDLSSQRRPAGARRERSWVGDSLTGWLR